MNASATDNAPAQAGVPVAAQDRFSPAEAFSFQPHRGLSNEHLQTIVGNYLPRPAFSIPEESDEVLVDASDGSRVLCHSHWPPQAAERLTFLLVHGLEGSSRSRYVLGLTARAWAAGCNVIRMNMRNCGGTDALTPTLYHSGLSGDVRAVAEHFCRQRQSCRIVLVGYSMGGNLVLKLAGELAGTSSAIAAVVAVCPAIDLAAGSDALHEPANRVYEAHFLRGLMRRFRRKAALFPDVYDPIPTERIRSLRHFDDQILARYSHFASADDYYFRAASARVLEHIALPTLILAAQDDPFIRLTEPSRAKIAANSAIRFVETRHGGHCAYLGRERGDDIHWAEAMVVRELLRATL